MSSEQIEDNMAALSKMGITVPKNSFERSSEHSREPRKECQLAPLRCRLRQSMASRKRQERCVWMARKMTEWPSKRRPLTKIRPSDSCKGDAVPWAGGTVVRFPRIRRSSGKYQIKSVSRAEYANVIGKSAFNCFRRRTRQFWGRFRYCLRAPPRSSG